jgi:glucan 1,6-alpha-isomaltosidase
MPSRRQVLKAGGVVAAGGLANGSLLSAQSGAATAAEQQSGTTDAALKAAGLPDTIMAPFHKGGPGPLYWSTYGYSNATNDQIPESVWKANVDWIAKDLAPYGYRMACTDGWIDGDQAVNSHGYIKGLNGWEHDWAWWADYLKARGMQLGIYYNPLWVTKSAVSDRSIRIAGRPDLAVADIVNPDDWFDGGGQLQWADATKDGAEEYVKGYVEYFANLGAVFLRIDFLSYYETGFDQSEGTIGVAHGRESYVNALRWISEAAKGKIQVSLVMPNLFNHAAVERQYGDLIRIDNDASFGTWLLLSGLRESWQPIWSQWQNPFQGFTGFSDVSGPGQVILDGDPLTISSYAHDIDRQSAINLFVMAGAAIAIADQYDNIGSLASFYQNQEILDLRRSGLVGKPVYLNGHSYDWDQESRDSERWVAQLPDGDWVVALFNRADDAAQVNRTLDFASTLGLTKPAQVRDLWAHQDVGTLTDWTSSLGPHGSSLVRVTPQETVRHQAEVGGFSGSARFENIYKGHTGMGYVTGLDTTGSSLTLAIAATHTGTHVCMFRVANGTGKPASLSVTSHDPESGTIRGSGRIELGASRDWSQWHEVRLQLALESGTNFIVTHFGADNVGGLNLDSVTVST